MYTVFVQDVLFDCLNVFSSIEKTMFLRFELDSLQRIARGLFL